MENTTKALLIAATVLIAVIMLSIAVYLYASYAKQTREYSEIISSVELEKFNSNFNVYVGRNDISAQEIVSVVNLAKEYGNQIEIYLNNSKIEFTENNTQEDFIKNNQNKVFKCILSTLESTPNPQYDERGKIVKLKFTK